MYTPLFMCMSWIGHLLKLNSPCWNTGRVAERGGASHDWSASYGWSALRGWSSDLRCSWLLICPAMSFLIALTTNSYPISSLA